MNKYAFKNDTKLTNYYPNAPLTLPNGLSFLNSEAAYHSQKFEDFELKKRFCNLNPDPSKKLSRTLKDFVRKDWDSVKYQCMKEVVFAKFSQNSDCLRDLLATGDDYLIEDTTKWHDNYWGYCTCGLCSDLKHENNLGKILMEVRKELM